MINQLKGVSCRYCGSSNDYHNWYCTNCYRCLDCQRIIKSKFDDPTVQAIKPLPKFEHTRNLVRTYCLRPESEGIRDSNNNTGRDMVKKVLGGNLDLVL